MYDNLEMVFNFLDLNFNFQTPQVTGVKVFNVEILRNQLIIDINLCWFSDLEFSFVLNQINGGISKLEVEGLLRVTLNHSEIEALQFTSIEICLMDYPHLDFELTYALAALGENGSLRFD
jgi:hypothetical protein